MSASRWAGRPGCRVRRPLLRGVTASYIALNCRRGDNRCSGMDKPGRGNRWARASRFALLVSAALAASFSVPILRGQDAKSARLIDQPPFDIVTLDKANDSKVYKIFPLALPGRKVPENPKATEKIRIKLLDSNEEYDVAW